MADTVQLALGMDNLYVKGDNILVRNKKLTDGTQGGNFQKSCKNVNMSDDTFALKRTPTKIFSRSQKSGPLCVENDPNPEATEDELDSITGTFNGIASIYNTIREDIEDETTLDYKRRVKRGKDEPSLAIAKYIRTGKGTNFKVDLGDLKRNSTSTFTKLRPNKKNPACELVAETKMYVFTEDFFDTAHPQFYAPSADNKTEQTELLL